LDLATPLLIDRVEIKQHQTNEEEDDGHRGEQDPQRCDHSWVLPAGPRLISCKAEGGERRVTLGRQAITEEGKRF
jgi:hypothetical protein